MATFAPHVERAVKEINARFPALGPGGTYPNHGEDEPGGLPEEFYSADFWSTVKSVHDDAFYWIIANAKRLGLHYVISWDRIWNIERADEGVRHYERDANNDGVLSPSERHTNHIHTSFFETPPREEDELPTPKDVWQADGTVNNEGFAPGSEGRYVSGSDALRGILMRVMQVKSEVGALENHTNAEFVAVNNQLKALDTKLNAILAKLP